MEIKSTKAFNRRNFVRSSVGLIAGITLLPSSIHANELPPETGINIIGPLEGYSPQVGTFVSMLNWMRESVLRATRGLSQQDLDFLHEPDSNTIGALLSHLAATEVIYQDLTFNKLQDFSDANKKKWSTGMNLGEEARKTIKGNDLNHYYSMLAEVREKTLTELKKRDDKWLAEVDPSFFGNQPTNNYCKWFHVCEHEANHRGQMTVIRKKLPK
jgi:uncharacterized damage-inducible protein DinB